MTRIVLLAISCTLFSGCAFLDEDLLLSDEEFEETFSEGGTVSGYGSSGGSWACGGRVRMGRMSMGSPTVGNYGVSVFGEYELNPDDINGRLKSLPLTDENGVGDEEKASIESFEDWHAEFIRVEEEWLEVDKAQLAPDDKVAPN